MFLAAVCQLNATGDEAENWHQTQTLVDRAASYGASLVATPECTNYLGPHRPKVDKAEPLEGPTVSRYRELAARHGLHLLVGSVNEKADDPDRCYNTSLMIGPDGALLAAYRKLHLFDVDIPGGVRFAESDTTVPGDGPVVCETALGTVGMAICYDLRFPELFQHMKNQGAQILAVPSAFTTRTGRDHWEPLLRARAIETQCYVLAPGQWGQHGDSGLRESYGHSLIVNPWGHILGLADDGAPRLALAEIDLDRVTQIRSAIPVDQHRRL